MLSPLKLPLMLTEHSPLSSLLVKLHTANARGLSSSGSSGLLVRFLFWGLGAGMLSLLKLPLTLHRAFSLVKFAGQTAHCHFQEVQLKWLFRASREVPLPFEGCR